MSPSMSSEILFKHRLMCLNYGFFTITHYCMSFPSSPVTVCCSIGSMKGTGSSGFLDDFNFLFFSMIWSRFLISAKWASTQSPGKGCLPMLVNKGLMSWSSNFDLASPKYSIVLFISIMSPMHLIEVEDRGLYDTSITFSVLFAWWLGLRGSGFKMWQICYMSLSFTFDALKKITCNFLQS